MDSQGEVLWTQQTKQFYPPESGSFASFNNLILDETSQSIYISGEGRPLNNNTPNEGTIFGENDTLKNLNFDVASNAGFIAKYDM